MEQLLATAPFSLDALARRNLCSEALSNLTRHHYEHSPEFNRIATLFGYSASAHQPIEELPFLPVRLFKEFELLSVPRSEIIKTMTSSGTTGQAVSKIFLDRATATKQTKVLVKIVSSFTGAQRLPLLIIDSPSVIKDRNLFSARGAAILGFSMLGCDPTYLLNDDCQIDFPRLQAFLDKHAGSKILLFGFTFVVWQHLCQALESMGRRLQLEGILLHGGGWKKLTSLAVDNQTFKARVADVCGITTVCNYYGMVEQTGSIFLECAAGFLHASIFSDIIVRDPLTLAPLRERQTGLLQVISLLPTSYPGHSLLTEDLGEILGEDNCACGRKGKYYAVHGRVVNAEVRGCSDVHAAQS